LARFGPESTVRQIVNEHPQGRKLLFEHGFDVGQGFQDVLSQYQTLLTAARGGRIRDLEKLVEELNQLAPAK
jgi:hypothetical protein